MAKITYIEFDGTEHVVDVKPGFSVMQGAVRANVPGIVAECGGSMSCSTCHVYVDEAWRDRVGKQASGEADLLDFRDDAREESRLACQIKVTDALDGLVVRMPETQEAVG
jgi:2Fe-2S ferredoxin